MRKHWAVTHLDALRISRQTASIRTKAQLELAPKLTLEKWRLILTPPVGTPLPVVAL